MGIQVGDVQVWRDIEFDYSVDRILETPPFPKWLDSRYSRDKLVDAIERLRPQVVEELDPRAMYRVIPIEESGIEAYSPPEPILEAEYVCPAIVTAGSFSDSSGGEGYLFDDLVRDVLENVALDLLTEQVGTRIVEETHEEGWNTTRFFAPGSGSVDWPLEKRAYLFEVLPAADIDVRLKDNGLVEPNKTITCVLGMGPEVPQAPSLISCDGCPRLMDCDYADPSESLASSSG